MTFKRMMALGAVAAALTFTGCRDRSQSEQDLGPRPADQTQPATGGSGDVDSTIPGSSDTIGGVRQDDRPGTELGGTGDTDSTGATGGSGTVHQPGTGDSVDQRGTGGAGGDLGTSGDLDQDNLDQRNPLDDQNNLGGSDDPAR